MKIGLHSKSYEPEKLSLILQVFDELLKRDCQIYVTEAFDDYLRTSTKLPHFSIIKTSDDVKNFNFMVSLGGDGTLLETVTYVRHHNVPILGINLGRLGFLATTSKENIASSLEALFKGYFSLEERTLIKFISPSDVFNGINFGLNDFTIIKRDTTSMIVVHTFIDGEYLNSYWADGLIIATPTGSTGYSLSVGGPVVIPHSANFIIAPVSPHNLNVRPLVVSDNCVISFEIEGRSKNFLVSLDSRSVTVDASIQMAVMKCDFTVKLVKFKGENFLNTLRMKLNWGLDSRN